MTDGGGLEEGNTPWPSYFRQIAMAASVTEQQLTAFWQLPWQPRVSMAQNHMNRTDRLFALLDTLSDNALHRAEDLAAAQNVSLRTLYRDIGRLQSSGVPVTGTRGAGYRLEPATTLPPLTLTDPEIEALQLALAIVLETTDPALKSAATSLAAKIDGSLPLEGSHPANDWQRIEHPFANAARGMGHLPILRAAIRARQKLKLIYNNPDATLRSLILHPASLQHQARSWILKGWDETQDAQVALRLDLIENAEALPELFTPRS
jgi:predicted DNA-binding transcriptional regulator YafY